MLFISVSFSVFLKLENGETEETYEKDRNEKYDDDDDYDVYDYDDETNDGDVLQHLSNEEHQHDACTATY